ncbi:MAG: DeoR/GlpR family DNA-binding transcription regulator [Eubacteriales bacterium]|nr:DeoR/GlpR family DNA-binding transcription regulator [Eubacteriales bacterium]
MFAEERQVKIVEMINNQGKIVVPELCEVFGVSASTIRNDLRDLEEKQFLTRTHGGAISISKAGHELLPTLKESKMMPQKRAIARTALGLINDGDIIAITSGTTTFELIRLLPQRKNLTIITNDIMFACWLENNTDFSIVVLGGFLRSKYHSTISPLKSELLHSLNVDKTFLSCNGISSKRGITTPNMQSALMVRDIIHTASEVYLLADSSKAGVVTFANIINLNELTAWVTDSNIGPEDMEDIQRETDVIIAQNVIQEAGEE